MRINREGCSRGIHKTVIQHFQNFRTNRKQHMMHSRIGIVQYGIPASWLLQGMVSWGLFKYPIRRLVVRSREDSKSRDMCLELSNRSGIWQAPRRQYCRSTRLIPKRCHNSNYQSHGLEASRDLMIRRLIEYWNGALVTSPFIQINGNSF